MNPVVTGTADAVPLKIVSIGAANAAPFAKVPGLRPVCAFLFPGPARFASASFCGLALPMQQV